MDDETTYEIVRFFMDGRPRETIETGLTLEEAQAHCQRDDTRGGSTLDESAWFDGYEAE